MIILRILPRWVSSGALILTLAACSSSQANVAISSGAPITSPAASDSKGPTTADLPLQAVASFVAEATAGDKVNWTVFTSPITPATNLPDPSSLRCQGDTSFDPVRAAVVQVVLNGKVVSSMDIPSQELDIGLFEGHYMLDFANPQKGCQGTLELKWDSVPKDSTLTARFYVVDSSAITPNNPSLASASISKERLNIAIALLGGQPAGLLGLSGACNAPMSVVLPLRQGDSFDGLTCFKPKSTRS